jgi:hypothetical protein
VRKKQTKAKTETKLATVGFPSGWRLFRDSLGDFRLHLWRYLALVGVVVIPSNLIGLSASLASDPTVLLYENLGSLFMTAALIWAVSREQSNDGMKLRQAYYDGSSMVLRFIVVLAMLAIMSLPAAIGLSLYSLGSTTTSGAAALSVQLLLGALALVLSLPTLYWIIRYGLSIVRLAVTDEWPVAAIKSARLLTLGYFWQLAGRVAQLLVWIILLMLLPALLFIGLALVTHAVLFVVLFQLSFSLIILPFSALYVYRLYRVLTEA